MKFPCYLQSYRSNAEHDEAFEERLREASTSGLLAHHHGTELAVVAHENHLTTSEHHWDHALWLCRLRALVN